MAKDKSKIYLIYPFLRRLVIGKKFSGCIHITDRCNLRCLHCYHKGELDDKEKTDLSIWEERFKRYRKMGLVFPLFLGGEPSLRMDLLFLAEKYFPFLATFTNGQIKISDKWQHRIHVSLEGLKEEQERVRGVGTFDNIIDNYKGDKRVIFNTVLSKANYSSKKRLQEFIDYIKGLNTAGLHIEFYFPQTDDKESYKYVLDDKEYREIGEVLLNELNLKNNILYTTKDVVSSQIKNVFPYTYCNIRDANYVIDCNDRKIKCVCDTNDCDFCRVRERYHMPLWRFRNWWQIKKIRGKYNLL